jgi:hypothetical protein
MAKLSPGVPVTQTSPELLVENSLDPGRYRFRLVVIDDGEASDPAELIVTVQSPAPAPAPSPGGTT